MIKKIFILLFMILTSFFVKTSVFAISSIPVEEAFLDIDKNYKYYYELQTLYDRGIIEPESDHKFHPDKLLKRDEFVGIAEETSCKKCIIPNVDTYFIDNYKNNPFFDIPLSNKYFYCISDAKKNNFVLGYKAGDSCKDGIQKAGEVPFCSNNNITREEALAVVMRMGGILTTKEADKITSGIEKGQNYPDLSNDVKPRLANGKAYSFYPYFKKALEYDVIDYDNNGNKKIYKLIEKKGNYLRPSSLITKEDFLKMAFIALKANSCVYEEKENLALKIEIFEKSCTREIQEKKLCKKSDLNEKENTYDFNGEVGGICKRGIDDITGYKWRFYNLKTGVEITKYGKYIDNYKFLEPGNYRIYLKVRDKCGNITGTYNILKIGDKEKGLSISINANPIIGNGPLEVDFESIVSGGKGPYKYIWNFGDGSIGKGKKLKHIFITKGLYNVLLTVIDKNGNTKTATVKIKVLNNNCKNDTDLDGVNDCDDKCPLIKGEKENDGCPVFFNDKENPNNGVSECILKQDKKSFIFGNVACNTCPCDKSIDFRTYIRNCDLIIPAITSPNEKEIYSRGNYFQIYMKK